jgi:hypothetical protein
VARAGIATDARVQSRWVPFVAALSREGDSPGAVQAVAILPVRAESPDTGNGSEFAQGPAGGAQGVGAAPHADRAVP